MEIEYVGSRRDSTAKPAWNQCVYCTDIHFKELQYFIRHLRDKHCTIEGGSFVCHYGYNSVCNSLPVEGVSDTDYAEHVYRHHAFPQLNNKGVKAMNRKSSTSSQHSTSSESNSQWTVFSASQNLAAVLNDPNRGKQKDFFTKQWGVDFVEKNISDIPMHPYLPDVNHSHFESYLRKISKRHRRYLEHNEATNSNFGHATSRDVLQLFPKLRLQRALSMEKRILGKPLIPAVFLQPNFDISKAETFYTVFPFAKEDQAGRNTFQVNGKLLQEKLTHDLDQVEVLIAEQVAQKSEAFFQAMTSHDSLMEQLDKTLTVVKSLRHQIAVVDECLVKQSLQILQLQRRKCNHILVLHKLKLMSTVHQTQPTIQTLLSTPDFVAALELISTTQELLNEELQGVHSFRHLGSQLNEINRLIDKMMSNEFENYSTKDLNRPFTEDIQVLEMDKLVSIMLGMLRRKNVQFISKYKQECFTTIKTVVKQLVLEALADNDCDTDGPYSIEQAQILDLNKWIQLMDNVTRGLVNLLKRIKAVHDVMKDTVAMAAGYPDSSQTSELSKPQHPSADSSNTDHTSSANSAIVNCGFKRTDLDSDFSFLTENEYNKIMGELKELLSSICDFSHDECAKLLTTLAKSKSSKDKSSKPSDKLSSNGSQSALENVSAKQMYALSKIIEVFTCECERISSKSPTSFKSAFQIQANKFINKFHNERKDKLSFILESECWRPAEVQTVYQRLMDDLGSGKMFDRAVDLSQGANGQPFLMVQGEKYIVVGAVLLLIQMVIDYASLAHDLSLLTFNILRNLAELLSHFNSRTCQLVLGAGALHSAGLKTITTTNLVLASRSLQLVLRLVPYVKQHFEDLLSKGSQNSATLKNSTISVLNEIESNMNDHISKLHAKVVVIVTNVIATEVANWGAKPPVPSLPFRNISKHMTKFHEAVAGVLPAHQVEDLYKTIHNGFKAALKEQLKKLNIVNNGGPQHGTVTSELIFYVEMLKKLHIFTREELTERSLQDIWDPK